MLAKEALIEFLRHAPKADDRCHTISLPAGTSAPSANVYLHRMRVELSRFRDYYRMLGKQTHPFKMKCVDITCNTDATLLKLEFRDTVSPRVLRDVNEIFDILTTGADTVDERELRDLPKQPLKF